MNIHEELGTIDYMFCDKTGTLTKNELSFKYLAALGAVFSDEELHQ